MGSARRAAWGLDCMSLREYLKLLRLHQRAGLWLLLWPILWALWLAAGGVPPLGVLAAFLVGTVLMRSANYAATPLGRNAPEGLAPRQLARVRAWDALLLFAALCVTSLVLIGKLNRLVLWLFLPAVVLAAGNAATGRFYGFSRSHLGLVFCFGIPMAYAAVTDDVPWLQVGLLMGASLCWILAYNAYSAAGAPVNPVYGGNREVTGAPDPKARAVAGSLQALALLLLAAVGIRAERGIVFTLGLLAAAGFALYQQRLTRGGGREAYIKAFLNNQRFGAAVFLGLLLDYGLSSWLATRDVMNPGPEHDAMLALHACTGPQPDWSPQAGVGNYGYCVDRNIVYTPPGWPRPMQLDLYTPQREGIMPAVVLLHGGHWQFGDRQIMGPVAVALARRGYVAITITYRLAPGARFPAQLLDSEQAVRWLGENAARLHVDPQRLGAWGFSAGGHLAALMATIDPADPWGAPQPPLRAVVAGGAPTDLEHFNPGDGMALFGVSAAQDPALYHRASPLYHASAKAPPIFLYTGSADTTVLPEQAEVLRKALADAGAPVELYIVRGAEHAGSTEGAMDPAMGFLDRQLKP